MIEISLIGIGTGNPKHLTLQAIEALNAADVILLPRKGADKADLADLRRTMCDDVVTNPATRIIEFDMPQRAAGDADYLRNVDQWHSDIAATWQHLVATNLGTVGHVALMVWGDPSLYDSSLRIVARWPTPSKVQVIAGITSLQALAAAHVIPINDIGAPFLVTTGRRLRATGWPAGVDTLIVMLDGSCSFQCLDPTGISIWWGAYLGMPEQILFAGPLLDASPKIVDLRARARAAHGWLMDIYILRRDVQPTAQS